MLPWVCTVTVVIDYRRRQNVLRTLVTRWTAPHVPLLFSHDMVMSSVICHQSDAQQCGIYLLVFFLSPLILQPMDCESMWYVISCSPVLMFDELFL